jgi:RNA polymerase sigma factor (sigma-70 family)
MLPSTSRSNDVQSLAAVESSAQKGLTGLGYDPTPDPSEDGDSDESLLWQYRQGAAAAFDSLYQRHEAALYRYILRMVHQAHLANDLFQEVWLALIRAPEAALEGKQFAPWLYTVARYRVIDHMRLSKNQVHEFIDADVSEDDTEAHDAAGHSLSMDLADVLHNSRMAEALMQCVQSLPALQREAFVLQAEGHLGLEEIAASTQSPIETVKSRLRYARNSIRKQMEGWR